MRRMAATEWALLEIGDTFAMRNGLPPRIPVPKEDVEGIADKGLPFDSVRSWIKQFMEAAPSSWRQQNNELASRFDAFMAKLPHVEKAEKAFASHDFAQAIKALQLVTRVDKLDHRSQLNLGMALAASGEPAKAIEHFEAVRATFAGDPDYHVGLANVLLSNGDRDKAVEELVLALEAKPDHKPAMDVLAQLGILVAIYEDPRDAASLTYVRSDQIQPYLEGIWSSAERDARYYLDQMRYHASEQRAQVALAAAERAAAAPGAEPLYEEIEVGRIEALRSLGRLDEANAAARALADARADSPAGFVELGRTARSGGNEAEALAFFDQALERDPGDQLALTGRFWPESPDDLQALLGAFPKLADFAGQHPESAGAWRSVARAKLKLGAGDEALELFARALGLAPDDDDLRAEYWSELGRAERFDQVIADAAKLPGLQKRSWQLRWSEAEAYRLAGRKMEARAAFTAINADETLHIDVRKRAKRAAERIGA
jgi:tetratricopeptide (TPR) repeat protein